MFLKGFSSLGLETRGVCFFLLIVYKKNPLTQVLELENRAEFFQIGVFLSTFGDYMVDSND